MNNQEKYNFSDFSVGHYKEIIEALIPTHSFEFFTEYAPQSKHVILRHDVDFSLESAFRLAKLENSLGVNSTFYLMLHCEYYSFLEKRNIELVKSILKLGHRIGLHFDSSFYLKNTQNNFEANLLLEKSIIESFTGVEVRTFSFHNPSKLDLDYDDLFYSGMLNAYSSNFNSRLLYCSDSNGYWRFNRMIDFVEENIDSNLQLLTHPIWWTDTIDSPKNKIRDCVLHRGQNNLSLYEEILREHKRENIDW
jgi:hypothetical protein